MFDFKRVLVKLTGESMSSDGKGIDFEVVEQVASGLLEIKKRTGCQMAIVIGGGNLMRGRSATSQVDRATADYIGMLATIMNGLALEEALNRLGDSRKTSVLMTAIQMNAIAEPFYRKRALRNLDKDKIITLVGSQARK